MLCDVFIADRERALNYRFRGECKCKSWRRCKCWDAYGKDTYDHVNSHRVYDNDFAQLLSILRGKEHRDSVIKEFKMLKEFSEEGPWIQKVPKDLPILLAKVTNAQLKTIAKEWSEIFLETYPIAPRANYDKVILEYLKLLQKLCKKAVKEEQGMYLWTCL